MMPMSLSRSLFCLSLSFLVSLSMYIISHTQTLFIKSPFSLLSIHLASRAMTVPDSPTQPHPPPFPNTFSFLYSSSIYLAHLDFRLPFRSTGAGKFSLRAISAIWEDWGGAIRGAGRPRGDPDSWRVVREHQICTVMDCSAAKTSSETEI